MFVGLSFPCSHKEWMLLCEVIGLPQLAGVEAEMSLQS